MNHYRDNHNVIVVDNAERLSYDEWMKLMIWAKGKDKKMIAFGTVSEENNTFTKLVTSGKEGCYYYTMDKISEESRRTDTPEIVDYFFKMSIS